MVSHDRFIAGIRKQVGWFVMIGLGALLFVLLLAGLRSNLFAQKFFLHFSPPSAASFYIGQPVKFQGFVIGHIEDVDLLDNGRVKVNMELLEQYRHMVHTDSVVRLSKEGLIGEQVVEISSPESKKPKVVEPETSIRYETEASLDQLLLDLKPAVANANVLLGELASLAKWMNDPNGDVRLAMSGLRQLTKGMRGGELQSAIGEFSKVLVHLQSLTRKLDEKGVVENLSKSLQATTKILDDLKPLSEVMGKEGAQTLAQVNALLKNVDALSKALNIVAADLSELTPELPGLARESRETIEEMQVLLKSLRGSWLFGGKGMPQSDEDVAAPPVLDMQP